MTPQELTQLLKPGQTPAEMVRGLGRVAIMLHLTNRLTAVREDEVVGRSQLVSYIRDSLRPAGDPRIPAAEDPRLEFVTIPGDHDSACSPDYRSLLELARIIRLANEAEAAGNADYPEDEALVESFIQHYLLDYLGIPADAIETAIRKYQAGDRSWVHAYLV